MKIRKSAEDYLEMVLMLQEEKGEARAVDIAAGLNVSKPSVSVAMKHLREEGYIVMEEKNRLCLTERGLEIARSIYDRHKAITQFLKDIGVPEAIAREDACLIEHDISTETYNAIAKFNEAKRK